jgi:hypothetical protein
MSRDALTSVDAIAGDRGRGSAGVAGELAGLAAEKTGNPF